MINQNYFYLFISFLLGSAIASFLYAWAMRICQTGETILDPSKCRFCEKKLSPLELIPILSWLIQRGRCYCQKHRLSSGYFISEIVLGSAFVTIGYNYPMLDALFLSFFASALLFFFLTDAMHQVLYVPMMALNGIVGFFYLSYYQDQSIDISLGGIFLGFAVLYSINFIYLKIKQRQGFGSGDKFLLASIGAWLGPMKVIKLLFLASWLGVIYVLFLMYRGRANLLTKLPLGLFLSLATPIIYLT